MEGMLADKVFPTPAHAEELGRVARKVEEIQVLVAKFVVLNQEVVASRTRREQVRQQTLMDEHELRLAAEGKTIEDPSIETVVRKKKFLELKKRGLLRPGRDVPAHQLRELRRKGGELYALKHDKP